MSIVVQQPNPTGEKAWRRRRSVEDRMLERQSSGRIREDITTRVGNIVYFTGPNEGLIEVCVQSLSANPRAPTRYALNITQRPTDDDDEEEEGRGQTAAEREAAAQAKAEEQRKLKIGSQEQMHARRSVSRLSSEVLSLDRKVQTILSNADYAKEQEIEFHEQSIAMNRASQYWPVIQLAVLIVTGFTQANHIVRFFKTRNIY